MVRFAGRMAIVLAASVVLAPTSAGADDRADAKAPAQEVPAGHRQAARYVAIGATVALASAGVVMVYAKHGYDTCVVDDRPLPFCVGSTSTGVDGANYYTGVAKWLATPLFGAGVVAVGVAAYLYLRSPSPHPSGRAIGLPVLERDRVGIAAVMTF